MTSASTGSAPSPDGQSVVYPGYPPTTQGHPPEREIILRLIAPDGSNRRDLTRLSGGQGTINVNSWAPDGRRFAFVAYPGRAGRNISGLPHCR